MRYKNVWARAYIVAVSSAAIVFLVPALFFYGSDVISFLKAPFQPRPRNIIMISVDTLRADHLGAYGYSQDTSPNLDRFAENAFVFEQAISQAKFTFSSHASLLTSQYPLSTGVVNLESQLPQSKTTLPEVLQQNGYATAAFVGAGEMSFSFGLAQGFETYVDQRGTSLSTTIPLAEEWLNEHKDKKFFLYVQGFDVHPPYEEKANKQFQNVFDLDYAGVLSDHARFSFGLIPKLAPDAKVLLPGGIAYRSPYAAGNASASKIPILGNIRKIDGKPFLILENETIPLTQRDLDHIAAHYDDGVLAADKLIEGFLEKLKRLGLYDNSVIIVFSGHGEELGDAMARSVQNTDLYTRGALGEELVHVPLLIQYPGLAPSRVSPQVQLIDLFPTILDFLNIPLADSVREGIWGQSFFPLMLGTANAPVNAHTFGGGNREIFVRSTEWKLVTNDRVSFNLYDLRNDPAESVNVAEQYPEVASVLQNELSEWYNRLTSNGS
ncbi:MAG: sulfatase [bacterium]|nr:sulfatase [bacterium]